MKFDLTRYTRHFPSDARSGRNVFDIEGVGKFFLRDVGNTSYCTGTEVYLHRTGRKSMNEYLIYHAHVANDGKVEWRVGSLNWQVRYGHSDRGGAADESRFPRHVLPIVQRLLDEGAEREPTSYIFSVMSSCDAEINRFRYDTKELRDTIDNMNTLLDPSQYRPGEWAKVPLDKMTHWHSLRDRTMIKLIDYMSANGDRWCMLERISRAIHRWCSRSAPERKIPVRELIAQATSERSLRKAPPMAQMWD